MKLAEAKWPCGSGRVDEAVVQAEKKKCSVSASLMSNVPSVPVYMTRVSGYSIIVSVMIYVFRFIDRVRKTKTCVSSQPTCEERNTAKRRLLRSIQVESKLDVKLKTLDVIKDEEGLLRVKTRITMRPDSFDFRYPILFPTHHALRGTDPRGSLEGLTCWPSVPCI